MDYQDLTAVFAKMCKICEHGGFLQSRSHIVVYYISSEYFIAYMIEPFVWSLQSIQCLNGQVGPLSSHVMLKYIHRFPCVESLLWTIIQISLSLHLCLYQPNEYWLAKIRVVLPLKHSKGFTFQWYIVILCLRDSYFVDVTWVDSTSVHVTWLNREQNTNVFTLYDTEGSGAIKSHYKSNVHDGWVELVSVCGQCSRWDVFSV